MTLRTARLNGPILAAAAAVVLAGCGSSSSSTVAAASSRMATATTATTATQSAAAAPAAGTAVVITTKHDKMLGTILAAGGKRLTVYLWERDHGATSACIGACAAAWPPVIGTPRAAGSAKGSDLGTITRADGATQVTYKGHPLYFFIKDKDDGDAYGEGSKAFGGDWYALSPSGNKVDKS